MNNRYGYIVNALADSGWLTGWGIKPLRQNAGYLPFRWINNDKWRHG